MPNRIHLSLTFLYLAASQSAISAADASTSSVPSAWPRPVASAGPGPARSCYRRGRQRAFFLPLGAFFRPLGAFFAGLAFLVAFAFAGATWAPFLANEYVDLFRRNIKHRGREA